MEAREVIRGNLSDVRREVAEACRHVGRDPDSVKLVAVTKYADWEWVRHLATLHHSFGEARPQQLAERQPQLPDVEWHLIGQLQRNKVRIALQHAALIHSVDSLKLLERISTVAGDLKVHPSVLLEVNVSGEASKSGFSSSTLQTEWPQICRHAGAVNIAGLMTMAPASDDPENARPAFRGLRKLRDQLAAQPVSQSAGLQLPELSMGMSGDFAVAVEEGATLIRIGSRLFDGLCR
ncbi:MAG: YggS family pyridoxal phosphate-dependent enzyme [Planctomycetaceae bacterium]